MLRERKKAFTIFVMLAMAVATLFVVHGALAQDNPPGCKNDVPGPNGFKNPNCGAAVTECNDGIDNDGDHAADGADDDCTGPDDTTESGTTQPQCSNTFDDDGDGDIDGADSGCSGPTDNTENNGGGGTTQCNDGLDNDGDHAVDMDDDDCTDPTDNSESGTVQPQCSNTFDDDGDGDVDTADSDCDSGSDTTEGPGTGALKSCEKDGLLFDDTLANELLGPGLGEAGPISKAVHNSALEGLPSPLGRPGLVHEGSCVVAAVEGILGANPES